MFKKPDKSKTVGALADRMRQVTGRDASGDQPQTFNAVSGGRAPRAPTFKQATITLSGGERMDVVVKNVSDTGARIEFFRNVDLPDEVLLSEPTLRLKVWARVMWQNAGSAGLLFEKS